jgi:hypothetical protein
MIRFFRLASSVFSVVSVVCFTLSAATFAEIRAFGYDKVGPAGGCGTFTNNGRCSLNCTAPDYCTTGVTCPCATPENPKPVNPKSQ